MYIKSYLLASCRSELFQLQCLMYHGWSSHLKIVTPLFLSHVRAQKGLQTSKYSEVWLIFVIWIQNNTKRNEL
jgi:hypothetical protein